MEYKDYYDILGVNKSADQAAIKKAYRKLARQYHPDVSKEADAETKFKDVSEAYTVLKDEEKRAAYDQLGSQWQSGQAGGPAGGSAAGAGHGFQPPPGWEQSWGQGQGQGPDAGQHYYSSQGDEAHFSDFFESLFGARGAQADFGSQSPFQEPNAPVGQDQHASVQLDLADAYRGTTRELSLSEPSVTPDGQLTHQQRTLKVKIPKGISQGQTMRLKGQGVAGAGGARGDLFLEIGFAPHRFFKVNGKDISIELPVSPWEAALGAKVDVPLPDGTRVALQLPKASSSGKQLRLKGKGIPASTPGNLLVTIKIVLPKTTNAEQQAAYEALQKAASFDPRAELNL